jgi:hypothetical protein
LVKNYDFFVALALVLFVLVLFWGVGFDVANAVTAPRVKVMATISGISFFI